MNKQHLLIIYVVIMSLLAASWLFIQSQTETTVTCYKYNKEIPCKQAYAERDAFIPSPPENFTFNFPTT